MPLSNMVIRAYIFFFCFSQILGAIVTVTANAKKYDAAHARVLATSALLEEEQHAAAVLAKEARAMVALIEPPSPIPPPAPVGRVATIIANIHVQATGVKNIRSVVSVTLDLSSTNYARWCDNVLVTLGHYSLSDHVLLDTTYVSVLTWDRMDNVVKSWIWGTISPNL
jgi:hypothetical protein